jgi:hypothetical protein
VPLLLDRPLAELQTSDSTHLLPTSRAKLGSPKRATHRADVSIWQRCQSLSAVHCPGVGAWILWIARQCAEGIVRHETADRLHVSSGEVSSGETLSTAKSAANRESLPSEPQHMLAAGQRHPAEPVRARLSSFSGRTQSNAPPPFTCHPVRSALIKLRISPPLYHPDAYRSPDRRYQRCENLPRS